MTTATPLLSIVLMLSLSSISVIFNPFSNAFDRSMGDGLNGALDGNRVKTYLKNSLYPLMYLFRKNSMPDVNNLLPSFYQLDNKARKDLGFPDLFFIQILLLKFCIIPDFPAQCRYYYLSCKTDRKNHLCLYLLHLVKILFFQLWQLFLLHLL